MIRGSQEPNVFGEEGNADTDTQREAASQVALWNNLPQCRRRRRCGFDPWVRKIPWRRKWQPTPVFLPGESHGQRSLVGYTAYEVK